jgi:hypothetical protein
VGWRPCFLLLSLLLTCSFAVSQGPQADTQTASPTNAPVANPARPTVSTPATLTPVGYLQFETGALGAADSPGLDSQFSFNEVIKCSPLRWLELVASAQPFAHSQISRQAQNNPGDVDLGVQVVAHQGEGANPTVAFSYFGRVYEGAAPDLDIASFRNSAFLLISGDIKGFHYDTNYNFNELTEAGVLRAAF